MRLLSATMALVLTVLPDKQPIAQTSGIPQSDRATNAISKHTPRLEREFSAKGVELGSPIFIRILKQTSDLELWVLQEDRYTLFKTYSVCAYSGTLGPKLKEGDLQSPEGFYFVTPNRLNPWSRYHLAFDVGFPNSYDRYHGRTGSHLMVHGRCVSIGCYAMGNTAIEEIYTIAYSALSNGQRFFRVHVFPFHMTDNNLYANKGSTWDTFWLNLKDGYDWFERHHTPPNVTVQNGKYAFSSE